MKTIIGLVFAVEGKQLIFVNGQVYCFYQSKERIGKATAWLQLEELS